jgi:magnesium transporter
VTKAKPKVEGFLVSVRDGKAHRKDTTDPEGLLPGIEHGELSWVNFEVENEEEAGSVAEALGFTKALMTSLEQAKGSAYVDHDTELGIAAPMIRIEHNAVHAEPLFVLVRDTVVVTLYRRGKATRFRTFGRYAETVLKKIPSELRPQDKVTLLVARLLSENNERNFDGIRPIEDLGEAMSAELASDSIDRKKLAKDIFAMKRVLIRYLDALWDSLDVIHSIRHGDAELISDDEAILGRVAILGEDVQRHIQLSEHMSEVLASGLEVTQSIYNNQLQVLNNRMAFIVAWLTILGTAVLVPNTLATVLAAAPPELRIENPTIYLVVMIGSTLFATLAAWLWIRLRVPLPEKLD